LIQVSTKFHDALRNRKQKISKKSAAAAEKRINFSPNAVSHFDERQPGAFETFVAAVFIFSPPGASRIGVRNWASGQTMAATGSSPRQNFNPVDLGIFHVGRERDL
jgi:hypothetical protein